jgi:hypothetical protein
MNMDALDYDQYIADAIRHHGETGVSAGADVASIIRGKLQEPTRNWTRWAIAAALAAPIATGTGVVVSTNQIRIHWDGPSQTPGVGTVVRPQMERPFNTTVEDAQARIGFHVRTLSGYSKARLDSVTFVPPVTAVDGKPIPHTSGAVRLGYKVGEDAVEIVQQNDPAGAGPMDVTFNRPGLFERPPTSVASVESSNGQDYLVFTIKGRVAALEWKPGQGAVMIIVNYGVGGGANPYARGPVLSEAWALISHLT